MVRTKLQDTVKVYWPYLIVDTHALTNRPFAMSHLWCHKVVASLPQP